MVKMEDQALCRIHNESAKVVNTAWSYSKLELANAKANATFEDR